jgi:hypothetical protein
MATDASEPPDDLGPALWMNWRAMEHGNVYHLHEYPLFSDAEVVWNAPPDLGPVHCFPTPILEHNTPVAEKPGVLVLGSRPGTTSVMFVRVTEHDARPREGNDHDDRGAMLDWHQSHHQPGAYHGANEDEELPALLSLVYGARLRAGPRSRIFSTWSDRMGSPLSIDPREMPSVPYVAPLRRVLPGAYGHHRLDQADIDLILSYPKVSATAATALVRAARWYQNAIWLVEVEPNVAWLMFVSAIEVAAVHWRSGEKLSPDAFAYAKPRLSEELKKLSPPAHDLVAENFARMLGSTKRFIEFVLEHLPEAPCRRPPPFARHEWTAQAFKNTLNRVYEARSEALHDGIPFPKEMCAAPRVMPGEPTALEEIPAAGVVEDGLREKAPINLHTFEYVTRSALKTWWRHMATNVQTNGQATRTQVDLMKSPSLSARRPDAGQGAIPVEPPRSTWERVAGHRGR